MYNAMYNCFTTTQRNALLRVRITLVLVKGWITSGSLCWVLKWNEGWKTPNECSSSKAILAFPPFLEPWSLRFILLWHHHTFGACLHVGQSDLHTISNFEKIAIIRLLIKVWSCSQKWSCPRYFCCHTAFDEVKCRKTSLLEALVLARMHIRLHL